MSATIESTVNTTDSNASTAAITSAVTEGYSAALQNDTGAAIQIALNIATGPILGILNSSISGAFSDCFSRDKHFKMPVTWQRTIIFYLRVHTGIS
jgi:hypothetical protein